GRPARRGAVRRPAAADRDRAGARPVWRRAAGRRGHQRAGRAEPAEGARPAARGGGAGRGRRARDARPRGGRRLRRRAAPGRWSGVAGPVLTVRSAPPGAGAARVRSCRHAGRPGETTMTGVASEPTATVRATAAVPPPTESTVDSAVDDVKER